MSRRRRFISLLVTAAFVVFCWVPALAGSAQPVKEKLDGAICSAQDSFSTAAVLLAGQWTSTGKSAAGTSVSADALLNGIQNKLQRDQNWKESDLVWADVVAQYPQLPVTQLPLPAAQVGRVSWQTYGVLMYERGFVLVPFRADGTRILPEEMALTAVEAGQHVLVATAESNTPIALSNIVSDGSSVDPSPEIPAASVTWQDVLDEYPGIEIVSQQIESGKYVWLTVALQFFEDGYTVLGFDSQGQAILASEMGTRLIEPGDHMAVFRTEDRELMRLVNFTSAGQTPSPDGTIQLPEGYPVPVPGSSLALLETSVGPAVKGISLGSGTQTTVADAEAGFLVPEGSQCVIVNADGDSVAGSRPVCTGDKLILSNAAGEERTFTVIVTGDVLGTGRMNLSQLVRLAQGFTRQKPLEGPYYLAGCWTGNSIGLTDLVKEAQALTGRK